MGHLLQDIRIRSFSHVLKRSDLRVIPGVMGSVLGLVEVGAGFRFSGPTLMVL